MDKNKGESKGNVKHYKLLSGMHNAYDKATGTRKRYERGDVIPLDAAKAQRMASRIKKTAQPGQYTNMRELKKTKDKEDAKIERDITNESLSGRDDIDQVGINIDVDNDNVNDEGDDLTVEAVANMSIIDAKNFMDDLSEEQIGEFVKLETAGKNRRPVLLKAKALIAEMDKADADNYSEE